MAEWYDSLTRLDAPAAIKKAGSEDFFRRALELFYESSDERRVELGALYKAEDWHSYTIKIHALKSVARIIGAMELGDEAESLETAGKDGDTDYIKANNDRVIGLYDEVCAQVAGVISSKAQESGKPEADKAAMDQFFKDMKTAAKEADFGRIGDLLEGMKDFAIPETDKELFYTIRDCFDIIDYDGIVSALKDRV